MERGEALLEAITDDVMRSLNPNDDDCWHCGGEGYTHDCFDGFCEDAKIGCEDCSRECPECVLFKGKVAKAIREAVIKTNDVHVATAWLKSIGRWDDSITPDRVRDELTKAQIGAIQPET